MIDYTGLDREISCTFIDQTNHRRAYSEKIAMSPIGVGFVILFRCLDDQDKHGCYPMADAIEILWKNSDMNLFEMAGQLMMMGHNTYFKLLDRHGFININHVGGCNSFSWEPVATEFREKLVFPHYTMDDIRVKHGSWRRKSAGLSAHMIIGITGMRILEMFNSKMAM